MSGAHLTAETQSAPASAFRVVQRSILTPDQELDVESLYVGSVSGIAANRAGTGQSGAVASEESGAATGAESSGAEAGVGLAGFGRVTEEGHAVVEPHQRLTLGTYFNAFPASYWRRWTDFDSVRLVVRATGRGSVIVYRSTSKGHVLRAAAETVRTAPGDDAQSIEFELSLKPFIDGGWYWFDVAADDAELELQSAEWMVDTERQQVGSVTIGITTFNRPDFCVAQLQNIASAPDTLSILDEVIVVDQGTQRVRDHEDFEAAAAQLGDKLRVIEQSNLGGSGGFSRSMSEALARGASDYVLLLDDDVVCELEGIRRAVCFADLAKTPSLIGGHMFSLYDRSVLHAYGETIAKYRWFWGPAPSTTHGHNFAQQSLRSTSWLHRRVDVDYNGWWMCLIPTAVIREIGLSLPMFIKWDDAEFGIRAQAAGYPTVSLPGVAVWHVPWTEKDDTLDWQAYFHERNRLVSGLLHSPYDRGGRLVLESLENHAKRMVSMQYATGQCILMALQDVLDGPERMHRDIALRLGEVRALRARYDDGQSATDLDIYPSPRRKKPPRKGRGLAAPSGRFGRGKMAARGLLRQITPVRELGRSHPESLMPHVDQRWWRLAQFDSVIVSSADGTSASWYKRDPTEFREQSARSARLHARLYAEWPALAKQYQDSLAEITSPEAWKPTFEGRED